MDSFTYEIELRDWPLSIAGFFVTALYYNPRTVYSGSPELLGTDTRSRTVPRTGWEPHGDSGLERDRVRLPNPLKTKALCPRREGLERCTSWLR